MDFAWDLRQEHDKNELEGAFQERAVDARTSAITETGGGVIRSVSAFGASVFTETALWRPKIACALCVETNTVLAQDWETN